MTTGLNLHILVVLSTDLTQLESGAHLTVQLILLLCDFDVVLRRRLTQSCQVWVLGSAIREQIESFPEAIYEGLEERFVVGNGLEYVSICCHVTYGPLAQPCTTQSEDVTARFVDELL